MPTFPPTPTTPPPPTTIPLPHHPHLPCLAFPHPRIRLQLAAQFLEDWFLHLCIFAVVVVWFPCFPTLPFPHLIYATLPLNPQPFYTPHLPACWWLCFGAVGFPTPHHTTTTLPPPAPCLFATLPFPHHPLPTLFPFPLPFFCLARALCIPRCPFTLRTWHWLFYPVHAAFSQKFT